MDQELLMLNAAKIESRVNELEEHKAFVESQVIELEKFHSSLSELEKSNQKETISYIGKGVHVKTSITDQKLFVEVGAGVLVRKSISQTKEVIQSQLLSLTETKNIILKELQKLYQDLQELLNSVKLSKNI